MVLTPVLSSPDIIVNGAHPCVVLSGYFDPLEVRDEIVQVQLVLNIVHCSNAAQKVRMISNDT
jgi:hypothetical protein